MTQVLPQNQQAQLFGLSTLIQLGKRARHAATARELGFIIVNEKDFYFFSYQHITTDLFVALSTKIAMVVDFSTPTPLIHSKIPPQFLTGCKCFQFSSSLLPSYTLSVRWFLPNAMLGWFGV